MLLAELSELLELAAASEIPKLAEVSASPETTEVSTSLKTAVPLLARDKTSSYVLPIHNCCSALYRISPDAPDDRTAHKSHDSRAICVHLPTTMAHQWSMKLTRSLLSLLLLLTRRLKP